MAKIGRILLEIAEIVAVVALTYYAPGIGTALGVSAFVVVAVGSVVIALGFAVLSNLLFKPSTGADQAKYNVRLPAPPRYIAGGNACVGGAVVYADFDSDGNLWLVLIHCDSILGQTNQYYFDTEPVTFDGSGDGEGWCITDDFCLNGKNDPFTAGDSGRKTYFYVWTRTYTEGNPTPLGVAALTTALPDWTATDHLLVGTSYSVMRCSSVKIANRYKVYRWRGALGMGEPSISVAGLWSNMYDPRDNTQVLGNRATYKPSSNSEIVWAWFRTHPYGRNKPESQINWDRVASEAVVCDQSVTGIEGTQPRYVCGNAIIDTKQRVVAEQEIMMSCDGQLVFDDSGKTWLRSGYFYAPTLTLSRNRDIIAMMSNEAQDGESETQGVIVNFLDPDAGYTSQPSAPWYNPNYYQPGTSATFLNIDILTCQNHNQAMRLAKAIGMRSQPLQKLGPTSGLRGLRALEERIINLDYDNTFAGDYEVCTPIEVDESGMFCSLGLVPIDANRYTLLPGEEKPKPTTGQTTTVNTPDIPDDVDVFFLNNQIKATFAAPTRNDVTFAFQYMLTTATDGHWLDMSVDMDALTALSDLVDSSLSYYVQWSALTSGGYRSVWTQLTLGAETIALPAVTAFTVAGGTGANTISWRNPTDSRFDHTRTYRGTTNVFTSASDITGGVVGGLGQTQGFTDTLAAGTYYYWNIAFDNAETIQSVAAGPVQGIVT